MNETSNDAKDLMVISKEALGLKPLNVKFKKLDERAVIPTYAHYGDVGMDMTAISVEYNEEFDMYVYHTGLAFESDFHYGQFLFPRSSNRKTDCYLANSVGIADSAIYRGEIMLCYKSRISTYERANIVANKVFMQKLVEGFTFQDAFKEAEDSKLRILEMTKNLEFAPYKVGDKIAQMVFFAYPQVNLIETKTLSDSDRGENGFGSTDKK